uniref:Uncharacterized protein n=1 Tax=Anguilla anguilla TaxID=7936 RepID=A0A0E9SX29_ANGAN
MSQVIQKTASTPLLRVELDYMHFIRESSSVTFINKHNELNV